MKKLWICVVGVILCAGSCSVFEKRDDCLGSVVFDFENTGIEDGDQLHFSLWDASGREYSYIFGCDEIPSQLKFTLPKGPCKVRSYYGFGDANSKGVSLADAQKEGFTVRAGEEFPRFHTYGTDLIVNETPWRDTVFYSKRYCNIEFVMAYDDSLHPYTVVVHGNIAGYDFDFNPREGIFRFDAKNRRCNIPAQVDGSLSLELRDENDLSRRFAIGQMIASSGYDWKALNLEDIVITLEYSTLHIKIGVDDWSETYEFNIEL